MYEGVGKVTAVTASKQDFLETVMSQSKPTVPLIEEAPVVIHVHGAVTITINIFTGKLLKALVPAQPIAHPAHP